MSNGVYPCHVSAYKNFMPLTFDGGASSLCKSLFTPGDFISRPWNGCILVQKTQATQSVDHACLFRVMSGNSRLTLTIRTSGAVCLRLYKDGGSVQRECQTTSIPTTGNVLHIGYSWDVNRLALSVYDTTAKALVQVVESTTNISSLPAWTEADGIYVGNRADLSLPYKGNIYGGTFGYGSALSGASMAMEAAAGNMTFGSNFVIHPQVMGYRGTGVIHEPNHHDITVLNPDKVAFWNLNAPSNVIQEWWRFYASIDAIPPGALVLDSDGVVKQKVGDFLIPVPVTIIGSGPLANAPVASAANQNMWYMSTDFGLCLSRRIVLLNGPDIIKFAPVASTLKGIDWMCSFCFLDGASSVASFATLFEIKTATLVGVRAVMTTVGKIELVLRNAGGTVAYLGLNVNYSDLLFHRIYLGIENGFFFAYTEKEAKQSIAVPVTWDGTGYTEAVISDFSEAARPLLVCGIRQNTSVLVDCIQCDDALGATVIANQCTPSRPATLSDATAHAYSWVPQSLLQ